MHPNSLALSFCGLEGESQGSVFIQKGNSVTAIYKSHCGYSSYHSRGGLTKPVQEIRYSAKVVSAKHHARYLSVIRFAMLKKFAS